MELHDNRHAIHLFCREARNIIVHNLSCDGIKETDHLDSFMEDVHESLIEESDQFSFMRLVILLESKSFMDDLYRQYIMESS